MLGRVVVVSRYVVVIAVASLFVGAIALLIYGAIDTVGIIIEAFRAGVSPKGAKTLMLNLIEVTDLFLIATVLYITSAGLYELFIDDNLPLLPPWLVIRNLDDLKNKLVSVVIVVLAVLFLGQVVGWNQQTDLLGYGVAIALVIVALTYFLGQRARKPEDKAD